MALTSSFCLWPSIQIINNLEPKILEATRTISLTLCKSGRPRRSHSSVNPLTQTVNQLRMVIVPQFSAKSPVKKYASFTKQRIWSIHRQSTQQANNIKEKSPVPCLSCRHSIHQLLRNNKKQSCKREGSLNHPNSFLTNSYGSFSYSIEVIAWPKTTGWIKLKRHWHYL